MNSTKLNYIFIIANSNFCYHVEKETLPCKIFYNTNEANPNSAPQ